MEESVADVIQRHEGVFQEGLGKLNGTKVTLHVDQEAQPKFYKPWPVPFALRSKIEEELNNLESKGVIVPVPALRMGRTHSTCEEAGWVLTDMWRFQIDSQYGNEARDLSVTTSRRLVHIPGRRSVVFEIGPQSGVPSIGTR